MTELAKQRHADKIPVYLYNKEGGNKFLCNYNMLISNFIRFIKVKKKH